MCQSQRWGQVCHHHALARGARQRAVPKPEESSAACPKLEQRQATGPRSGLGGAGPPALMPQESRGLPSPCPQRCSGRRAEGQGREGPEGPRRVSRTAERYAKSELRKGKSSSPLFQCKPGICPVASSSVYSDWLPSPLPLLLICVSLAAAGEQGCIQFWLREHQESPANACASLITAAEKVAVSFPAIPTLPAQFTPATRGHQGLTCHGNEKK